MCGIAGILRITPPGTPSPAPWVAIPELWLDILDDSIKHRGPDGAGRFRDRAVRADGSTVDVALVHRRLSIIDHACGHQPMVALAKGEGVIPVKAYALGEGLGLYQPGEYQLLQSHRRPTPDASTPLPSHLVAVAFNGCIYNHRELRKELQAAGHVFSTDHSDTEVLVHGWREWGHRFAGRLDGMYALAMWDGQRGSISLARDSFGEKPLYFAEIRDYSLIAFASSAAGLQRLRAALGIEFSDQGDPAAAYASPWIKYGWNLGLMPLPHVEEVVQGEVRHFPCDPDFDDDPSESMWPWGAVLRPEGAPLPPDALDAALADAVASRLEADVPVGCFLSGGLDSSLIAAFASRSRKDITAFTVRMPLPEMDESEHARAVANRLGMRHEILNCRARPGEDLVMIIQQLGLPFGDSSLLPTTWISHAARTAVRVALAGDGGDELFLGYDRHRALRWFSRLAGIPSSAREALAESVPHAGAPRSRFSRAARLLNAAASDGYKELVAIFPSPLDVQLGLDRLGGRPVCHGGQTLVHADPMQATLALRFDRMFYLPADLLRKTDTASMSAALEVRAPMLAPVVARPAINAPISSLMPRNQRKGLLREVARKYFPPEVVDRPKMGFAIPIGEWFRTDYGSMRTLLLDHLNSAEPFGPPSLGIDLNMAFIRQMLKEHDEAGEKSLFPWKGRDHSQRLYMLLVLSIWAKWLGSLRP